MDDLVAWLSQILDEDEARLSHPTFCGPVWPTTEQLLADIAAKRAMIDRLNGYCWQRVTTDGGETWHLCGTCDRVGCATIRDLASGYADRLGYREEWRP